MNKLSRLDDSVQQSINVTERYYREQIFSSGCSSLVPIFRINSYISKIEIFEQQLCGSPYIQKDVAFSPRIIESLLDVDLYRYNDSHFFFQGDVPKELETFIDEKCTKLESIAEIVKSDVWNCQPDWCNFEKDIHRLVAEFPILKILDLNRISKQIFDLISNAKIPETVKMHLKIYSESETWRKKFTLNQCSLYFMMEMANQLRLPENEIVELSLLGLVKDLGYTRLSEQVDNFEVMHPLVSYQLIKEIPNDQLQDSLLSENFVSSILVHHEFADGSGPLARMRHPLVTQKLHSGIPLISQISGLSDLYFGFLTDYSPTLAFSITCGFVLGQGNVKPRYLEKVIHVFSSIFGEGDYKKIDIPEVEASILLESILGLLKDKSIRGKAEDMIKRKTDTWYERITLALNIVRNISFHQPQQLSENSLINVLNLPIEFGLNY